MPVIEMVRIPLPFPVFPVVPVDTESSCRCSSHSGEASVSCEELK